MKQQNFARYVRTLLDAFYLTDSTHAAPSMRRTCKDGSPVRMYHRGAVFAAKGERQMPQPWDRPYIPKMAIGSLADTDLYLAVGKAISAWEGVEAAFASLFSVFTSKDGVDYQPAVRAFGVVNNVMLRADMIKQAAEAHFHIFESISDLWPALDAHKIDLKRLLRSYKGWSGRRNDVAHGFVQEVFLIDEDAWVHTDRFMYLLVPSLTASQRRITDWYPDYRYNAGHLNAFVEAFSFLANDTHMFCAAIDEWTREARAQTPLRPI